PLERGVKEVAKYDGPSEAGTTLASLVDPLKDLPKVAVKVASSDPISALAYSSDGTRLAAGNGRAVLLFDLATHKLVDTLRDHPGPVTAVRFTRDGKTLVAVGGRPGQFGAVTIWDLEKKVRRHDLRGHDDEILAAALAPDGR